jgi:hypothetical protein
MVDTHSSAIAARPLKILLITRLWPVHPAFCAVYQNCRASEDRIAAS